LASKGTKLSPERRAKISASLTGRKQSAETIAKRIASNTGKKRSDNYARFSLTFLLLPYEIPRLFRLFLS